MTELKKAYLDSDICINWLQQDVNALEIFRMIEDESFEGIISLFTLMEIMKVYRDEAAKKRVKPYGHDTEILIKRNIISLMSIQGLSLFEENSSNNNLSFCDISGRAKNILAQNPGRRYHRKFYSVHAMDACHLTLAEKVFCDGLITCSRDIKEASKLKVTVYQLPQDMEKIKASLVSKR